MADTDKTLPRIERWRRCYALALQRARMARRQGRNRLVVLMLFMWTLLSAATRSMVNADYTPTKPSRPRSSRISETEDWPVTDYERGLGGDVFLRPRSSVSGTGRYRSRATFSRLMADLRRPAAREDAARMLLTCISDSVTRAWVAQRIAEDQINRLAIWVRPWRPEADTLAMWRGEADTALADEQAAIVAASLDRGSLLQAAKMLESLAGTEAATSSGPKAPGGGCPAHME